MSRGARIDAELMELLPALHRFGRRFYSSQPEIDDLVQETLVKALSNIEKFEEGTRLQSWLFTIMRNTFCTRFGLSKREHVGVDEITAQLAAVLPQQEWALRGRELEAAIADLPEMHRSALKVVFIDGTSYEDAAREFNCAVGTLKSRVNRARERLTNQLDRD